MRVACCLLWAGCLDGAFCCVSGLTEEADGLFITIGRVILALDDSAGFLGVVDDLGAAGEGVVLSLVVIWRRLVGPVTVVLFEPVVGCWGAVCVMR